MSRPLRIEYPGAYYHVIQRGLERREIFRDDADYEKFLNFLSSAHKSYGINIHVYCLMPNHYHLIVETPKANLKKAMHMINTGYSVYFNRKNRRAGPLVQGRYKSPLIEADEYLDHVSRYIHLNPVKEVRKLVEKAEEYRWSSYKAYLGREEAPDWLRTDFILGLFGRTEKEGARRYKDFIDDLRLDSKKIIDENTLLGIFVGGKVMLEEIKKRFIDSKEDAEIPKIRQIKRLDDAKRLELIREEAERIIGTGTDCMKAVIYLARKYTGYSLNELSSLTGELSYSGISQVCRRLEKRLARDRTLAGKINKISRKVSNVKT